MRQTTTDELDNRWRHQQLHDREPVAGGSPGEQGHCRRYVLAVWRHAPQLQLPDLAGWQYRLLQPGQLGLHGHAARCGYQRRFVSSGSLQPSRAPQVVPLWLGRGHLGCRRVLFAILPRLPRFMGQPAKSSTRIAEDSIQQPCFSFACLPANVHRNCAVV